MEKIRELKKELRSNGQKTINGKPVSYLLSKWNEVYEYVDGITVKFTPISRKYPANVAMYVNIEAANLGLEQNEINKCSVFYEDYLLRYYNNILRELSERYTENNKIDRLVSTIRCEMPDCRIIKRSGLIYRKKNNEFVLKVFVLFPTGGGVSILGERMSRMITDILKTIDESNLLINRNELKKSCLVYEKQQVLRKYCEENNYAAFVADGSVLPRKGNGEEPLETAVPFDSPDSLRVTVPMQDGTVVTGMAIPKGVTVITGAGFSGKTTLLEAIEDGIYDHVCGDGREFVVSDRSLLITNAEDGRVVSNENISMFFRDIPFQNVTSFYTEHASGSVSQAANIIEAILCGSKLLAIDEDKSAANFMMRDETMRKLIQKEVIIPFTDRIDEIARRKAVSVILVIGGSGEYLKMADTVIMIDKFKILDVTQEVKEMSLKPRTVDEYDFSETDRVVVTSGQGTKNLVLQTVCNDENKKIICGDSTIEMTAVATIKNNEQLHSLAKIIKELITADEKKKRELNGLAATLKDELICGWENEQSDAYQANINWWYDEVRVEDIVMCINRMRGLEFEGEKDSRND